MSANGGAKLLRIENCRSDMAFLGHEHSTYPPLDTLKPVADGLWIVDSGPHHVLGLTLPVRMTVIRLSSGDLLLHSPTRFLAELKDELEQLGPIRHLVAPNVAHWSYLKDWHEKCPGATTWAVPGLRNRRQVQRSGLTVDHDLGDVAPADWARDIGQIVVPGAGFRELAFLHKSTRTLILTDLMMNLEPEKLPWLVRPAAGLVGLAGSGGKPPLYLRLALAPRRREAAQAVSRILEWAPERVIFAHGRWFQRDGTAAVRGALGWLLT